MDELYARIYDNYIDTHMYIYIYIYTSVHELHVSEQWLRIHVRSFFVKRMVMNDGSSGYRTWLDKPHLGPFGWMIFPERNLQPCLTRKFTMVDTYHISHTRADRHHSRYICIVCISVYVYIYIYLYVYIDVCIYRNIHIYTFTYTYHI